MLRVHTRGWGGVGESARLCHERTRSSLHWNCSDSALGSGNVFRATTMTTEQAEGLLWSVAQLLQHLRLSPPVWSKTKGAGVHGMEKCACVRVSVCARLPLSCLPLPSFLPTRLPPQRLNHLFSLVPCLSPYNFDPSPSLLLYPTCRRSSRIWAQLQEQSIASVIDFLQRCRCF